MAGTTNTDITPLVCPTEHEEGEEGHGRRRLGGGPITGSVISLLPWVGGSLVIANFYPWFVLFTSMFSKGGLEHSLPNIEKNS